MSNEKSYKKHIISKNNYKKCQSFSQYLNQKFKYVSSDYNPNQKDENNFSNSDQNKKLKYTKFNGSKSIILSNINSFTFKEELNINLDIEKKIKENISFISTNTKSINIIPKIIERNKISFIKNKFISQNYENNNNNGNNCHIFFNTKKNLFSNISEDLTHNNENENLNKNININITPVQSEFNIIKENKFNMITESHTVYRQDYYIKQFKVQYSIWLRNILNFKLSSFLKKIKYNNKKFLKFYPLNSLKFTANPKYKDNKIFLSMKIKEILIIGINGNKKSNQKKNKDNIEIIEQLGEQFNIKEDLIEFLNMSMEESVRMFYKSEQFEKLKNSTQAKLNDDKFFKEKKFSLLEENGFIFLIKNFNGNSKS